ncbi:hypothetical protein BDQ12DRAFT_672051 [Crucibulum laeve]|uniref:Uncharacterized protein n=1 Tax=Crucibulum laeve TaxID=68775 RepID=A0A5C3LED1_9AGAR|nr:hypothetical protein BDQ12DRAFT_672051 [Crucibulum laeve]
MPHLHVYEILILIVDLYCDLDRDWWIYFVPEQVHTIRLLYITEEARTTAGENFQRVYTATSWPSYHYSREPTGVHTLHVSGLELEDCFHAAAIFPNVSAVWLDGKRVPASISENPLEETLKLLAKEAPEEFAKETVRMLSKLKKKINF